MRRQLLLVAAFAAAACGTPSSSPEEVTATSSPLLRAGAENGRPYVVMIQSRLQNGGVVRCSGTLFAPRVVVTAAHCIYANRWPHGTFVYWGNDYANDVSMIQPNPSGWGPPVIPPQSQQNVWGMSESEEIISGWSYDLHHPDLAVLYLDRKPPFDPIPIYRPRLDESWVGENATLVGWGASKALSADITQNEGVGIKRSGVAPIMGTPTASDFHADDPNAGILDPTIRSHIVKTDGTAPRPNPCAGDSGGALIVNKWGQDYLAGVSFWTGLWCEGYGMWTRLDPFLPFLDEAYRKGGQANVIPRLECVEPGADGTYAALFSYRNDNGMSVSVPYGDRNSFPLDARSSRPTIFDHGEHPAAFWVDFTAGQQLTWKLSPTNSPTTELRVTSASKQCSASNLGASCMAACKTQMKAVCDPPVEDYGTVEWCYSQCMDAAATFVTPECPAQYAAVNRCIAALDPADPMNWFCFDVGFAPFDVGCGDAWTALYTCLGWM